MVRVAPQWMELKINIGVSGAVSGFLRDLFTVLKHSCELLVDSRLCLQSSESKELVPRRKAIDAQRAIL